MSQPKVVVVGAGHLGKIHARLLAGREDCQLVGVVDPDGKARNEVAENCSTDAFADIQELPQDVDAAVIAAPTWLHHGLALELIARRCHLLIEKPMTVSVDEADQLVDECEKHGLILQAGHVERFNPAFQAAKSLLRDVKFMQATRCSGFTGRSVDIGVVHDLMIHDLDLVMTVADSPVTDVEAMGVNVFGPCEDMAHARLKFANGCVANLSASRTSYSAQREMQTFGPHGFCQLDFAAKSVTTVCPSLAVMRGQIDVTAMDADQRAELRDGLFDTYMPRRELVVHDNNAIEDEHSDFITAIRYGSKVRVCGRQARDVLLVAQRVLNAIATHQWVGLPSGPVGPLVQVSPLRKAG